MFHDYTFQALQFNTRMDIAKLGELCPCVAVQHKPGAFLHTYDPQRKIQTSGLSTVENS